MGLQATAVLFLLLHLLPAPPTAIAMVSTLLALFPTLICCRQQVLPLVCKRWAQLALSPGLLRVIKVAFRGNAAAVLPRVRALACWLARVAPSARIEQLVFHVAADGGRQEKEASNTLASLAAALAVCGSTGLQQQELCFPEWPDYELPLSSWAGMLGSRLRSLAIICDGPTIILLEPLTALAALESLDIAVT